MSNPNILVLLGPDLGHTYAQDVVPLRGTWRLDGPRREFSVCE